MQTRSSSGSRVWGGLLSGTGAAKAGVDSSWKAVTGRGCMIGSDRSTARSLSDSLLIFSSASKGWGLKWRAYSAIFPCLEIGCSICSVHATLYYNMLCFINRSSVWLCFKQREARGEKLHSWRWTLRNRDRQSASFALGKVIYLAI